MSCKIFLLLLMLTTSFSTAYANTVEYNRNELICDDKDMCIDMKGVPVSGLVVSHNESTGKIRSTSLYVNGKKNGLSKSFWEDGTIKSESFFINGRQEGVEKIFRDNKLLRMYFYVGGVKEGMGVSFYREGMISALTPYRNGLKHGIEEGYFLSGQIDRQTKYEHDKQISTW